MQKLLIGINTSGNIACMSIIIHYDKNLLSWAKGVRVSGRHLHDCMVFLLIVLFYNKVDFDWIEIGFWKTRFLRMSALCQVEGHRLPCFGHIGADPCNTKQIHTTVWQLTSVDSL